MSKKLLVVFPLLLLACAKDVSLPKNGEEYALARQRLIKERWQPIHAVCNNSNRNICFQEFPELSTSSKDGNTCGKLALMQSVIETCTISSPDSMQVKTSRHVR